jgi:hypothetical protein
MAQDRNGPAGSGILHDGSVFHPCALVNDAGGIGAPSFSRADAIEAQRKTF